MTAAAGWLEILPDIPSALAILTAMQAGDSEVLDTFEADIRDRPLEVLVGALHLSRYLLGVVAHLSDAEPSERVSVDDLLRLVAEKAAQELAE